MKNSKYLFVMKWPHQFMKKRLKCINTKIYTCLGSDLAYHMALWQYKNDTKGEQNGYKHKIYTKMDDKFKLKYIFISYELIKNII